MAGIDLENRKIEKSISMYGVIIAVAYIVYLCIVEHASIYRYIIYLIIYVCILVLDVITLKKYAKNSYVNGVILTIITMSIFTGEYVTINTLIMTGLVITFSFLLQKIQNIKRKIRREEKNYGKNIHYGFLLAISNMLNYIFVLSMYKFFV